MVFELPLISRDMPTCLSVPKRRHWWGVSLVLSLLLLGLWRWCVCVHDHKRIVFLAANRMLGSVTCWGSNRMGRLHHLLPSFSPQCESEGLVLMD